MWKLFLLAVRAASQVTDVRLRSNAAYTLRDALGTAPTAEIRMDAENLLSVFQKDIAHSVRSAARIDMPPP
jgi:hypothetical protein